MKKIISAVLALCLAAMAFCMPASAADNVIQYDNTGVKECTDPSGVFNFVLCDGHESAPIRIIPAKLEQDGKEIDIYLIGLVGVETQKNQVNVFKTTIPSAFAKDNIYVQLIKEVLSENIPEGSNLVFAGHSLGGMVAQQIIADSEVMDKYNIVATITAGSPYIMVRSEREGSLVRLCDKWDAVPFLSEATLFNMRLQISTRTEESGGYFFNPDYAHNVSYRRGDVWGDYDALGFKDGNAKITFDFDNIMLFGRVPND